MSLSAIPLRGYQSSSDAYLLVDASGRVRMMNGAAASLLGCDPDATIGKKRCWEVLGLRATDGSELCAPSCRVRRSLSEDAPVARQRVVRVSPSGLARRMELFTLLVRPVEGWSGVLHMLSPSAEGREAPGEPRPGNGSAGGLEKLTPREIEVLSGLAGGASTRSLSESLCISVATLRNHVRSILAKLEVHSRLDAVLIWLSASPRTSQGAPPGRPRSRRG